MDKQQLRQYRRLIREIDRRENEKRRILDRYLSPPQLTGMPASHGSPDRIATVVAQRDRYQRIIDSLLDELNALREWIEATIASLPSADRELIRMRYIDGMRWEEISVELGYSYRHTHRQHGRILEKIKER